MKEDEVLVRVEGLSKKFCKDLKTGLWYGMQDLFSNLTGNKKTRELREKEFWALRDINFELRRGECLGLIGHNGAGKSTLLKILNGLMMPDAGRVTMRGRVGALIELGAGFNPILSGRENIYNNGAILGFTRNEINEKLEEIIEFAEIGEFIDMPVQHYSSGMKVRLGFAIAAQMEPDVLIIDEVLAVGDLGFVLKCFKTIDKILPYTAIIFVSHSMPMISRICSQIILLEHGIEIASSNDVAKTIDLYYSKFSTSEHGVVYSDGSIELQSVEIESQKILNGIKIFEWHDDIVLHFCFRVNGLKEIPRFNISFTDKEQRPVAILMPNCLDTEIEILNNKIEFYVKHSNLEFSKGFYNVNISAYQIDGKQPYLRMNSILNFQVTYKDEVWEPFMLNSKFSSNSKFYD